MSQREREIIEQWSRKAPLILQIIGPTAPIILKDRFLRVTDLSVKSEGVFFNAQLVLYGAEKGLDYISDKFNPKQYRIATEGEQASIFEAYDLCNNSSWHLRAFGRMLAGSIQKVCKMTSGWEIDGMKGGNIESLHSFVNALIDGLGDLPESLVKRIVREWYKLYSHIEDFDREEERAVIFNRGSGVDFAWQL